MKGWLCLFMLLGLLVLSFFQLERQQPNHFIEKQQEYTDKGREGNPGSWLFLLLGSTPVVMYYVYNKNTATK